MRVQNWENRLHQAVETLRAKPFDWARHNCSHFGGACVEAVTGANPIAHLTGTYTDEAGAISAIAAQCPGHPSPDIETAVATIFPATAPGQARRGDLGVATVKGHKVLFVVLGQFAAAPGPRCMSFISRTKLTNAFRVD